LLSRDWAQDQSWWWSGPAFCRGSTWSHLFSVFTDPITSLD
jgi:hypothetical protein